MSIKAKILELVLEKQGVKLSELYLFFIAQKKIEPVKDADYFIDIATELVQEGKLIEVHYLIVGQEGRSDSFLLPLGSEPEIIWN